MKTTLILQNEFLENLFCNQNETSVKNDLYNFLLTDFSGYDLICDFNNEEEYQLAVQENPIWEMLLDKIDKIAFNKDLEVDLKKENFYKHLGEHNLFLTTYSCEECNDLCLENGYIYLSDDNIDKIWSNLIKDKRNNFFKVSNSSIIPDELKFNSWSKLDSFCYPLTSILIFDKYILNNSSNQKLKYNLFPLLERLLQNVSKTKKITITIISESKKWEIRERQEIIHNYLIENGYTKIEVNIIKHFKAFYPRDFEGLHGRIILTNYLHIRCDDSFNLFKKDKINNDADIKINFALSAKNRYFYEKELSDIKKYISRLENNEKNPNADFKKLFHPTKNNNLLN